MEIKEFLPPPPWEGPPLPRFLIKSHSCVEVVMRLVDALLVAKAGHADAVILKKKEPEVDVKMASAIIPKEFDELRIKALKTNAPGDWLKLLDAIYKKIEEEVRKCKS